MIEIFLFFPEPYCQGNARDLASLDGLLKGSRPKFHEGCEIACAAH